MDQNVRSHRALPGLPQSAPASRRGADGNVYCKPAQGMRTRKVSVRADTREVLRQMRSSRHGEWRLEYLSAVPMFFHMARSRGGSRTCSRPRRRTPTNTIRMRERSTKIRVSGSGNGLKRKRCRACSPISAPRFYPALICRVECRFGQAPLIRGHNSGFISSATHDAVGHF
jgi:hypothetical protein